MVYDTLAYGAKFDFIFLSDNYYFAVCKFVKIE